MASSSTSLSSELTFDEEVSIEDDNFARELRGDDKDGSLSTLAEAFELVWTNEQQPVTRRIACLDNLLTGLPLRLKKRYRQWRWKFVKDEVPNFAKDEAEGLRDSVAFLYRSKSDLTSFSRAVWDLRGAFKDTSAFHAYLEAEYLFPPEANNSPPNTIVEWKAESLDKQTSYSLSIEVLDSPVKDVFLSVMSKRNEFGCDGKALSIEGSLFKAYAEGAYTNLPLPSSSPLLSLPSLPSTRQMANCGDVVMSIFKHHPHKEYLQIVVIQRDETQLRAGFLPVGRLLNMPASFPHGKTSSSCVPFYVNSTTCI